MDRIETVIVGGGQAGLATSYHLTHQGHEHLVLDKSDRAASSWREGRWDSFTLVTPNWSVKMPGAEYDGPDRDGFMGRDDLIAYFEGYVDRFNLPVQYGVRVESIEPLDGAGYILNTSHRSLEAKNVVVATGYEQLPRIPVSAPGLPPDVMQIHSSMYRNPGALPPGAVLVIGSAQSGRQIAEELNQSGRDVFLSTGGAGRAPRRYRGRDVFEWLCLIGFFDIPAEKFPVSREQFRPPQLSGRDGGHTLNLHQFARDGVTMLGHLHAAEGHRLIFAPDLHQNLEAADKFEISVMEMVDGYIRSSGLDAPMDELPRLRDGYEQPVIEELKLGSAGITTVIWATGYTCDYRLVRAPVIDEKGFPLQTMGVTQNAGLYFVGMPWMPALRTGILVGVGESARHIAESIVSRAARGEAA